MSLRQILVPLVQRPVKGQKNKKKHFLIAPRWLNICWLPRSLQYFAGGNAGSVAYFGKKSSEGSGKRRNEGAEQGGQMGTERNMTRRG